MNVGVTRLKTSAETAVGSPLDEVAWQAQAQSEECAASWSWCVCSPDPAAVGIAGLHIATRHTSPK